MILVTGATGQCGGALVRHLVGRGEPVRALSRWREESSVGKLRAAGVEVVKGDMLVPATLEGLFDGVEQAFLVTTPQSGFEEEVLAGVNFVEAARAQGLRHLVFLSVLYADTDTPHCATKGRVEEHLKQSGVPYTILRAGYFLDTIPNYFIESELRRGSIVSVINPEAPIHWIAVDDIGRAAARVLDHNRPEGKTYDLVCPQPFSMKDVARVFGEVTGLELKVEYTPVSTRALLRGLAAAGYLDAQRAECYLESIADADADYHAAVSQGDVRADPARLTEEFDLCFASPEAYVREFSLGMAGKFAAGQAGGRPPARAS